MLKLKKTAQCISPIDGSVYAQREYLGLKQTKKIFAKAKKKHKTWRLTSIEQRAKICHKAIDNLIAMEDEIVIDLAWQMGRPVQYGAGELRGLVERARYMIAIAAKSLSDEVLAEKTGFYRKITRESLGVVFVIAPWNYPFMTAINSIIPALMSGNCVVLKHSRNTLKVGETFQKAFNQTDLPENVFTNIMTNNDTVTTIISSGLANMVCFTGSVSVGKIIEKAAAGNFIGVGLELGGKDAAYVRADCNLTDTINNIADGAFFNSGQSCCSIERIYVAEKIYKQFVQGLVKVAQKHILANPLDQKTTLGPMINAKAADFVRKQIIDAVKYGAKTHIDNSQFILDKPRSAYKAPQILTEVNHSMSVMSEESFAPVVGVISTKNDNEALKLINDSQFGLTASIWTKNIDSAMKLADKLQVGTVFMNRCDYIDPALAWTGVKDTGRGCSLSTGGYTALTRAKSWNFKKAENA